MMHSSGYGAHPKSLYLIADAGELGAVGGSWVIDRRGYNIYVVGPGDTYASIASAFLGDAARWAEIWLDQSDNWRNNTKGGSTNLAVGDQLYMPQEAVDAAKADGSAVGGAGAVPGHEVIYADPSDQPNPIPAGGGGSPSPAPRPSPAPSPSPSPGPSPSPAPSPAAPMATWKKIAIGLGAVAAIGGIAFAVHESS
jgi:hypothetical protein